MPKPRDLIERIATAFDHLSALTGVAGPVLGPVWVWLAHGEVPSGRTLLGGAVLVAALLLHLLWQFHGPTWSKPVGLSV